MTWSRLILFIGMYMPFFILGQNNTLIPIQDETYEYLDYQITANNLSPHFILNQPYRFKELGHKKNDPVLNYFKNYWKMYFIPENGNFFIGASERIKKDENIESRYKFYGGVIYSNNLITFANVVTVDQNYKYDNNFAGDLSEADHWIYGRINDAYAELHHNKFEIFYGRTSRNWGVLNEYSLILSNNPYTYDHLLLSMNLNRIKFSFIFAQLDEYRPVYSFQHPNQPIDNVRRNLVGHRLDVHFSNSFQMAFTEMATYGGPFRPFEWAFVNPMNFYYPIQRNDRKQMDGFWCIDVFWKPLKKTAIWGQFLIDDIIVNNDPGVNDRNRYPDRLGILFSIRKADLITHGSLFSLTYVKIWNRTYQSKYSWENYHYRGYSLGYPKPSLEEFKLKFLFWKWFPLYLSNELTYGRYGAAEITDLFPLKKEEFPIRPVVHNLINHFKIRYFYSLNTRISMDVYYRKNPEHYSNRFSDRANWVFQLGISYFINFALPLD